MSAGNSPNLRRKAGVGLRWPKS